MRLLVYAAFSEHNYDFYIIIHDAMDNKSALFSQNVQ